MNGGWNNSENNISSLFFFLDSLLEKKSENNSQVLFFLLGLLLKELILNITSLYINKIF